MIRSVRLVIWMMVRMDESGFWRGICVLLIMSWMLGPYLGFFFFKLVC